MKKENKIAMYCFLAASICFYISSFFYFIGESTNNSIGIVNLCLGSTFLCLFAVHTNKNKDNSDKNK